MTGQPDPRLRSSLRTAAGAAGAAVSLLGALVLLGWVLDWPLVKSLHQDWVTMKVNAALAFLLAGATLRILGADQGPRPLRRFGHAGAVLAALIGGLTLLEYVFGWDLGIDQLLVAEPPGAVGTVSPGRMAPTTAFNFLVLGTSLLLLGKSCSVRVAQRGALFVAGIGALNLLGYTYGVPALYDFPEATAMAAHTAVAFVLLGLGILCAHPGQGMMATLTSPGVGGVMMRRLLPVATGGLLLLGWLRAVGERAGLYGPAAGTALFTLAGVLFFLVLVSRNAGLLNRLEASGARAEAYLDRAFADLEAEVEVRTLDLQDANVRLQKQILERERVEEALRRSEEQYRFFFESHPLPVWVFDLETLRFLAVNEAAVRHYGYSRDEFLRMTLKDIRPAEDIPALLGTVSQLPPGLKFSGTWRHRKRDGALIDVEITSQPLTFNGLNARLVLAHDVTDRLLAAQALRESEERFHTLARVSPVGIFRTDAEGLYVYVNERWGEITGLTREQARSRGWSEALHPDDRERVLAEWERATKEGAPFQCEHRFRRPDGVTTWILGQAAAERGPTGEVLGYVGTSTDITERKLAEEALRQAHGNAERRRQEAEGFARLMKELATPLDLDRVLAGIVSQAKLLGQADLAFLALIEANGEAFAIRAQTGAASSILPGLMLPKGWGMGGRVLERGAPQVTDRDLEDPLFSRDFDPVVRAEGIRTQVAVPIIHEGKPLGALLAARRTPRRFSVADVQVLARLADAAGLACHHALLYEQATNQAATLARLWQVGQAMSRSLTLPKTLDRIVEAARDLLRTQHAVLALWDEQLQILKVAARAGHEDERLVREFRPGRGAHGTAAATRQPLIVNDYRTFPGRIPEMSEILTATLTVPLLIEDRLIGTLGVYATEPGRTFSGEDLKLLELLAPPAAAALENARLHAAAVRRGEELAALLRAAQTVMAGLDVQVILERIAAEASRIAGVPYVTAFLVDTQARLLRPGAAGGATPPVGFEFPVGTGFSGTVAATGQPLVVPDARNDPRRLLTEQVRGLDFASYLGLPIKVRGEVVGVLAFYSVAERRYAPEDLAYLTSFADQAAVALDNARLFEQVRGGRERLRALSQRLVEVHETKSRELARELHDQIGQVLTGLKLTLEMSARLPAAERQAKLAQAQAMVDDLLTRVRELSLDLRPPMLDDLGLLPALLWQFERYTVQTHVRVDFEHTGLEKCRLPLHVETAAYRIVQEALTNVARHAGVQEVTVRLWADPHTLRLQVEDRGTGFDPEQALASHATSGLAGMRERAALLRGGLTVESAPGAGARVTAELPLGGSVERRVQRRDA